MKLHRKHPLNVPPKCLQYFLFIHAYYWFPWQPKERNFKQFSIICLQVMLIGSKTWSPYMAIEKTLQKYVADYQIISEKCSLLGDLSDNFKPC